MRSTNKRQISKIIVISDTHFGDESMLLHDEELADKFVSVLANRGEVSELILLGDILDLWAKTPVPALKKAQRFIGSLSGLDNVKKMVFLPGNHDHELFLAAFCQELDKRIKGGDLSMPDFQPARHYPDSMLRGLAPPGTSEEFPMTYPFVVRDFGGRKVLFTHGHHLDYFASSFWWARTFFLSKWLLGKRKRRREQEKVTLHDIEMANIPFYGALADIPWAPELADRLMYYYRIVSFFTNLFRRRSPLRGSDISKNFDEIELLLPLFERPRPAGFVFGHTHEPGLGKIEETGMVVANTGGWVVEKGVPLMTWVEVDTHVELYSMDNGRSELIESEALT
jgi:UDP-2,3-diacylglucosamine pyrophosphatase LpxH